MSEFETITYEEIDAVAWVTLNRPEVHNAFNVQMQHELKEVWRGLRTNDDVRCAVLTGAGDRAFCAGIDRQETMGDWDSLDDVSGASATGTGGVSDNGVSDSGISDGAAAASSSASYRALASGPDSRSRLINWTASRRCSDRSGVVAASSAA